MIPRIPVGEPLTLVQPVRTEDWQGHQESLKQRIQAHRSKAPLQGNQKSLLSNGTANVFTPALPCPSAGKTCRSPTRPCTCVALTKQCDRLGRQETGEDGGVLQAENELRRGRDRVQPWPRAAQGNLKNRVFPPGRAGHQDGTDKYPPTRWVSGDKHHE